MRTMRNYNLGSVCPICSGSSQLMECFILLMSETRPGGGQTLDNLVTLISALLSLTASHWSHLGPRRPVRGLYIFSCPVRASDWILLAPMLQCSNAPMLQCSNAPMHLTREKLSFGRQEMSGNVGKYGETQAKICPYSQQTLKV